MKLKQVLPLIYSVKTHLRGLNQRLEILNAGGEITHLLTAIDELGFTQILARQP